MSKGLGPAQQRVLSLLLKGGGVLAVGGILAGLFGQVPGPETKEYGLMRSSISRTLRALRDRELVETYAISAGGHAAVVAAITAEGVRKAREIEWGTGE